MTEYKRPADPNDEADDAGALPDWLREEPADDREFEIPDWLDDPEDDVESPVGATPPEVAVPRVSPAWVTRDIDVDDHLPATPAAEGWTPPRRLSAPLIALAMLIVIAAVLFVALVVW